MYRVFVPFVLVAFVLVPAGCQNKGKTAGQAALTTAGRKTMSREDFEKAVKGKTAAEVVAALGQPDTKVSAANSEEYTYAAITTKAPGAKPDVATVVRFKNGRQTGEIDFRE
jgi:hypothetical protein